MPSSKLSVAIDLSSSRASSICLFRSGHLVEETALEGLHRQSELLFGHLDALLSAHGLRPDSIQNWILADGPGSFTGLRVAMAAVKAICLVTHAPITLVCAAEARALAWAREQGPRPETPSVTLSEATPESKLLVLTPATSTTLIVHRFAWGRELRSLGFTYESAPPIAQPGEVVLSQSDWPSRSRYLPLAPPKRVLRTPSDLGDAEPLYYASSF